MLYYLEFGGRALAKESDSPGMSSSLGVGTVDFSFATTIATVKPVFDDGGIVATTQTAALARVINEHNPQPCES